MRIRQHWLVAIPSVMLAGSASAEVTGAAIRETPDIIIHVDQRNTRARDTNNGTTTSPLLTINEAATRAIGNRWQRRSTKIVIHPGVYRENVEIGSDAVDALAPSIVFEGTVSGEVILSGSDKITQWEREADRGVFRAKWTKVWGPAPIPAGWDYVANDLNRNPVVLRREMVFVNGTLLKQVLSLEELRAEEQTFFVTEPATSGGNGILRVHVSPTLDLPRALVEAGSRPSVFAANRIGQVVLRNLVFQHASSPIQNAAVRINESAHILIEDCRVVLNNWGGVALNISSDITLRRVQGNSNGASGVGGWRVKNLLVVDSEASYNNWRGAWGQFFDWATGQKFFSLNGARFVGFKALQNRSAGLWLDTDNANVSIEGADLSRNQSRGLYLEASQGPVIVRNSTLSGNGESGLLATAAANVTLDGNTISHNNGYQIFIPWLSDTHVSIPNTSYWTGAVTTIETINWTMVGNTISAGAGSFLFTVGNWGGFFSTMQSNNNVWSRAQNAAGFGVYPYKFAPPSVLDFSNWQQSTGQDISSKFVTTSN